MSIYNNISLYSLLFFNINSQYHIVSISGSMASGTLIRHPPPPLLNPPPPLPYLPGPQSIPHALSGMLHAAFLEGVCVGVGGGGGGEGGGGQRLNG